ncbi:MAG: hypothetical protein IJ551_09865 [Prevotella sp.]|nr:hypothetical protein [Prevotella sp.]
MAKEQFTRKEMENAVMLAADLYERMYNNPNIGGGSLEVAQIIISEAVKMEAWLTEKHGEDDDSYLDRLEEYEEQLEEKYDLPHRKQIYTVSYVGLSDSEYEANGYCETFVYRSQEKAEAKLKAMRDALIENCKAEGRDYEILKDEDLDFRMSWCGHGEQVRIEITDDYLSD